VDLDVVFLGTSASAPTARRGTSAVLVRRGGDRLLLDCGEGTQRQLLRSSIGLVDLDEVFLTHLHADHYLGLPGMLKTFSLRVRETPLTVYGPAGLRDLFEAIGRIVGKLTFPLELVELRGGDALARDGYQVCAFPVAHRVPALGYGLVEEERPGRFDEAAADALGVPFGPERGALQRGEAVTVADGRVVQPAELVGPPRRGRTVVYTGDTAPTGAVALLFSGADLLIHEATFDHGDVERAAETGHSTARQAAEVARDAGVGMLALTHVSPRYYGPELLEEAREIFQATVLPRDFDVIEVPLPERGDPELIRSGARPARQGGEEPVPT
jgi:ribonuclease Z